MKNSKTLFQLKSRSGKRRGLLLLGLLILLLVSLPLIETAGATTRAGINWGARSSGAPNDPYSDSWRKTDDEITRQWQLNDFLGPYCFTSANGYSGFSNEGVDKDVILYQAQYLSDNFDYVAFVDFDHGVGGYPGRASGYDVPYNEEHYMFEDDYGTKEGYPGDFEDAFEHGVYDMDIYNIIPPAKAHFVFIDACQSANIYRLGQGFYGTGNQLGLPFAFTHRYVSINPSGSDMSADGYNYPDLFPQCYIGFPEGSAALDQQIDYYGSYSVGPRYYTWVEDFFYLALNYDISVKDALDMASYYAWECEGLRTALYEGQDTSDSQLYGQWIMMEMGNLRIILEVILHWRFMETVIYT